MAMHKVSELDGALLDAAVAKAEGLNYPIGADGQRAHATLMVGFNAPKDWAPSRDWSRAGPIIERERICVAPFDSRWVVAVADDDDTTFDTALAEHSLGADGYAAGPSALIAAMRAYVASKFGDEVELL